MLTPDDSTNEGNKIGYLDPPKQKWRGYDPALFDFLQKVIITNNLRDTKAIEEVAAGYDHLRK